jgi:hypothetical protein
MDSGGPIVAARRRTAQAGGGVSRQLTRSVAEATPTRTVCPCRADQPATTRCEGRHVRMYGLCRGVPHRVTQSQTVRAVRRRGESGVASRMTSA